ncbi:lytic murein transglycosylase B [Kushneria phyllosphaerae]|uniref:Membrane-bound lytic murein transglycosylase B n=1 Tax=Kushneria phyllosphaerae TaxID=2100822 RepID=A0A2R8CK58_9GAMM|nr:lytic murein transglycosylase B [Kushneria phyllosphaerae]SPJ33243.1 Membrane-bound lytic murein transglycosylase B [Kushneria phyllosphaerae]
MAMLLAVSPLVNAAGEYDPSTNDQARAMVDRLAQSGLDRRELTTTLAAASRQQKIIDAISKPAEHHLRWDQYRNIFIKPERVAGGVEFIRAHRDAMARAEQEYGVPREIIAAIIGVETWYGRHTGSYRVIDALTTLAFDYPPRSDFFGRELEAFLTLTSEQGLDPMELKGSYAGAMGLPQFMPSSYQAYAVDFDNDGIKDLWKEPVDAIGSVANYFAEHGWRSGQPLTVAAHLKGAEKPADVDFNQAKPPYMRVADLEAQGITPDIAISGDQDVIPLALDYADGHNDYLLGLHNFYVITRYNHSHLYAMAVTTLAEQIQAALQQES